MGEEHLNVWVLVLVSDDFPLEVFDNSLLFLDELLLLLELCELLGKGCTNGLDVEGVLLLCEALYVLLVLHEGDVLGGSLEDTHLVECGSLDTRRRARGHNHLQLIDL